MLQEPSGWNLFSEEVGWYVYDFFRWELNGYEKVIFYSYYINGMTLKEIASASDCSYEQKNGDWVYRGCSFQYIGIVIADIEKRLAKRWKNRDTWKALHDSKRTD